MSSPVEGQEIATAILAAEAGFAAAKMAVERAATPENEEQLRIAARAREHEWNRFWQTYGGRLDRASDKPYGLLDEARRFLQGNDGAEDLVQQFLLKKVMPNPDRVFGAVSRGEKPLWPLLRRSLINFAMSAGRRKQWRLLSLENLLQMTGDEPCAPREPEPHDPKDEVPPEEVLAQRLECIRAAFRGPSDLLYHLLLKEQLVLLERIGQHHCQEGGVLPPNTLPADTVRMLIEMVEHLSCWRVWPELEQRAGPLDRSLAEIWSELTKGVRPPRFEVPSNVVEVVLGLNARTWNTYVWRARRLVVWRHRVETVKPLFPYWPPGVFSQGDAS